MGRKFCRLRKVVAGKWSTLVTNTSCGYKREQWYKVIIQIEDTGIIKIYGGYENKIREMLAADH